MYLPFIHRVTGHRGGGFRAAKGLLSSRGGESLNQGELVVPLDYRAPFKIDNSSEVMPIDSQERWPACVSFTIAGFLEARAWRTLGIDRQIDPLPLHHAAIKRQGGDPEKDGTTFQNAFAAGLELGLIPDFAKLLEINEYRTLRWSIHHYGFALCGFRINEGWNQYNRVTGTLGDSTKPLGGHAVLCCGYDDEKRVVFGPNQWGEDWADKGYWRLSATQFREQFMDGAVITSGCI